MKKKNIIKIINIYKNSPLNKIDNPLTIDKKKIDITSVFFIEKKRKKNNVIKKILRLTDEI